MDRRIVLLMFLLISLSTLPGMRVFYSIDHSLSNGIDGVIEITDTLTYVAEYDLDLSELTYGLHYVFFQVVTNEGKKSIPYIRHFFKTYDNDDPFLINRIEYFVDVDPGYGNGVILDITPGVNVQQIITADMSAQSIGLHYLGIRAANTLGRWSQTIWYQFFTLGSPELPDLQSICWYFRGPGIDENDIYQIDLIPGTHVTENIVIPLTHLLQDESYYLHIFGKSVNNKKSLEQVYPFTVNWIPQDITIQINEPDVMISWGPILGADYYKVFSRDTGDGDFEHAVTTPDTLWIDSLQDMMFYRVLSGRNLP